MNCENDQGVCLRVLWATNHVLKKFTRTAEVLGNIFFMYFSSNPVTGLDSPGLRALLRSLRSNWNFENGSQKESAILYYYSPEQAGKGEHWLTVHQSAILTKNEVIFLYLIPIDTTEK